MMLDEKPTGLGHEDARSISRLGQTTTETIDLDTLFTNNVTSTGSFDVAGGIWATTFGKVMQVLPIPALLVDDSHNVAVCNQACRKISPDYEKICNTPFSGLFPYHSDAVKARSVVTAVLSSRKPRVLESIVQIEGGRIWGRITLRPIRVAGERLVLTLIEDLTLEKKQSLLDKRRREDLEKLVRERTGELEGIAEKLRKEIDRRKGVEKDLRKSEASYKELVQGVNSIILRRDLDGNITFFNRFAQRFFDYTEREILGKNVAQTILPKTDSSGTDLLEMTRDIGIHPERYVNVEHENVRRNGERVWVSWTNKAITDGDGNAIGILSVGNDITERKVAEAALRESKETIEALLNATSDLAFLLGHDGTFLAVNEQVAKQLRIPGCDLLGKSLFDLAPAGLAGVEETRFQEVIRSSKPLRFEAEQFGKVYDNNVYPVLDLRGTVIAVAVYIRDITAEKKTNELLMQSARIKAVGAMASGVAHNFNNLLQIVMNAAYDILADLESNDVSDTKSKIKRILKSASAGAGTVRRLQDFACARSDETAVEGKVFDLSLIAEQTVDLLKPYWKTNPEKRGIKIFLHRDLNPGCLVRGKEDEMIEVVVNLLKNAVEALPAGGEISISTHVHDHHVLLRVRDNGVGIAQANLERIFEPFWSTKGVDGIGMGLASSYGIIRRHKGEVFAESALNKGTVFTVRLPLEDKSAETRQDAEVHRARLAYRILVIDDSEDSVWVLRNGLTRAGQEVLESLSGRQGIDIFKKERVDAIICDLGMPEINGLQVAKVLKEICLERGIEKPPFILLTGWGGLLDEKDKLGECGVDRVVGKPFLIHNLMDIVFDLLEERRSD